MRLLPELADGPIDPLPALDLAPEQERRLLFGAVARYLANVAGPAGTLLVLDDLHWAGADALDLLSALVRSADHPVRVLGAYRDTDVRAQDALPVTLTDLARAGLAWRHVVGALSAREAAELLDSLLADTAEMEAATRVREKLGTLLEVVGDYDAAQGVLEEAVALYRAVGAADRLGHALEELGWVHSGRLALQELIARLRPEVEPLEAAGPSVGLVGLCAMLAFFYGRGGQYAEQLAMAERARGLAERLGDTYALLLAQQRQGMALLALGREAEALRVMEAVVPLAEATERPVILCTALLVAGAVYEQRGEFARRRRGLARVLEINERREARVWLPSIMADDARVLFFLGEWPAARRELERALALGRAVNLAGCVAPPLLELGWLCLAEGAWAEACGYLDEAIAVASAEGDLSRLRAAHSVRAECDIRLGQAGRACERLTPLLDGPALREWGVQMVVPVLAWALLECGDGAAARELLAHGIARARSREDRLTLVDLLRVQALVEQRQGRWAEAAGALEAGLTLAQSMPYPYAEGRLLHVSGALHAQVGAAQPARELLAAALARFRQLGAARDADQAERDLAELTGTPDRRPSGVRAARPSA